MNSIPKHPYIKRVVDERHLTIPWHMAGQVLEEARRIAEEGPGGVGKYLSS